MTRPLEVVACRSCGAGMVWTESTKGNDMPVDHRPDVAGTFRITQRPDEPKPLATFVPPRERDGEELYTCHFATCPNAATHRKKKGA